MADEENGVKGDTVGSRKGGWKTLPFIAGNEICEKLAVSGLHANLIVYLTTKYNISKVGATNVLNVWSGTSSLATLPGAFVADAYLGKFWTIAMGCFAYMFGMSVLTMTAIVPSFHPSGCEHGVACKKPNASQMGILVLFFVLMTVGSAGIRPCSMAFGAEQLEELKRKVESYFNWYYMSTCVALMLSMTVIVYVQSNISWSIGFGVCAALMLLSTLCFLAGAPLYIHRLLSGSPFSASARVIRAAFRKRHLTIPQETPGKSGQVAEGRSLGFLDKAAVMTVGETKGDVCSAEEVENLKSMLRTLPIFSCGIANHIANSQQHAFTVLQALSMNRHLGSIVVPAGSVTVISLIALTTWLPIYDRLIVPTARRRLGLKVTPLDRMGVGYSVSAVSMMVGAGVEMWRRSVNGKVRVIWLAPQLLVGGVAEAFHTVGHLEFFYGEFPTNLRSTAIAVSSCTGAIGRYLSAVLVSIVHGSTGWLQDDLRKGHLDYFYWLLAALEALNLVYFVLCARWYYSHTRERKDEVNSNNNHESMEMKILSSP